MIIHLIVLCLKFYPLLSIKRMGISLFLQMKSYIFLDIRILIIKLLLLILLKKYLYLNSLLCKFRKGLLYLCLLVRCRKFLERLFRELVLIKMLISRMGIVKIRLLIIILLICIMILINLLIKENLMDLKIIMQILNWIYFRNSIRKIVNICFVEMLCGFIIQKLVARLEFKGSLKVSIR